MVGNLTFEGIGAAALGFRRHPWKYSRTDHGENTNYSLEFTGHRTLLLSAASTAAAGKSVKRNFSHGELHSIRAVLVAKSAPSGRNFYCRTLIVVVAALGVCCGVGNFLLGLAGLILLRLEVGFDRQVRLRLARGVGLSARIGTRWHSIFALVFRQLAESFRNLGPN